MQDDGAGGLGVALADKYDLRKELGQGAMATVYLAEDRKHGRPVAIKVLRPEVAASIGSERFLREIDIVARLAHPHVLPLHDSGAERGALYYVMPYVDGGSLRGRLDETGPLGVEESLRIAGEVADALRAAHAVGVIHRDLKPENILLLGGHAMLADFGIAAVDDARPELTRVGTVVGSPAYMSPEQAAGDPVDERGDLYSLGCVLFEMLTGRPPFEGHSSQAVTVAHVSRPVPTLASAGLKSSRALEALVVRALAKNPADRFQTAEAMAQAMASVASGKAPGGADGRQRSEQRARSWTRAAAVVAVGVGAVALFADVGYTPVGASTQIRGTVVDPSGAPVPGVLITVDGTNVQLRTDSEGYFVGVAARVEVGDVITLRASHPRYGQQNVARSVGSESETFSVVFGDGSTLAHE